MSRTVLLAAFAIFSLSSCKKENAKIATQSEINSPVTEEAAPETAAETPETFDISSLPVSNKDIGSFPYYVAPDWLNKDAGYDGNADHDFTKFEIYTGSGFHPVEGKRHTKVYGAKAGESWNEYRFTKSFSEHFESIGAQKIWAGEISFDVINALNEKNKSDDYAYKYSSGALQDNQITYGMNHNGKPVFFIIAANSAYGSITTVESAEFEQTVTVLKADEIQKDLAEKGKAVLYINFDTNKATLKKERKDAVAEITKALKANEKLKIGIHGHTDNTGNSAHNLTLSKDRAATVLNEIVGSGVDNSRLTSDGFGDKNPVASNDTEEGKAKNRRVELVRS